MPYYPDQRYLLESTTIRRERFLPENVIGRAEVRDGASVNLRDIVARGRLPSPYIIVEAAEFFRLKDPDELKGLMMVEVGETVEFKTPLAQTSKKRQRLLSPDAGVVVFIGDGRIIIQTSPETLDLEAGLDGQVVGVQAGRGVTIETFGGLVQGVWGNGGRTIGILKIEPEDGLESIYGDQLNIEYRGAIVVTRKPLRATGLMVMEDQGIDGVIAPSMETDMLPQVQGGKQTVLLTEGFGSMRMSVAVMNLLTSLAGRQALLDAVQPSRWDARRPEVVINPSGRQTARPPRPNIDLVLQPGTMVRLTRAPNAGSTGQIIDLPKMPNLLENGLRVQCAQVQLLTGEKVTVPLANLEVFGR
ncbi:MAG: hypothetical protein JNJ61_03280 [Anaerolineae bacterium]|nr:hypothetical protein [Anaerolineae bacterium]